MIKINFLDEYYSNALTDLEGIIPIAGKETVESEIKENLYISFLELKYSLTQYSRRLDNLSKEGTPVFKYYFPEIQQLDTNQREFFLEIYDRELSYHFKSFIIFSKAVMDRLIPFFDHKFGTKLAKFSKKGKPLLNYLENNFKGSNRESFINLLKKNKYEWLDDLIELRDEIIHFSLLKEYVSFHNILKGNSGKSIKSFSDLRPPVLRINGGEILAIDFLQSNFNCIKAFVKDFVALCYS